MPKLLPSLLDLRAAGRLPPGPAKCFYCGRPAVTVDHAHPRSRKGSLQWHNLHPSCRRCNLRKKAKKVEEFRARLAKLTQAFTGSKTTPLIKFYGEGARGASLRRLHTVLDRVTIRDGELIVVAVGEPLTPPQTEKEKKEKRAARQARPRWWGRFTFHGQKAIRAIALHARVSLPDIEHFVMEGESGVTAPIYKKLVSTLKALKLDRVVLRSMKPPGGIPKPKKHKRVLPIAERIAIAQKIVEAKTGQKPRVIPFKD